MRVLNRFPRHSRCRLCGTLTQPMLECVAPAPPERVSSVPTPWDAQFRSQACTPSSVRSRYPLQPASSVSTARDARAAGAGVREGSVPLYPGIVSADPAGRLFSRCWSALHQHSLRECRLYQRCGPLISVHSLLLLRCDESVPLPPASSVSTSRDAHAATTGVQEACTPASVVCTYPRDA